MLRRSRISVRPNVRPAGRGPTLASSQDSGQPGPDAPDTHPGPDAPDTHPQDSDPSQAEGKEVKDPATTAETEKTPEPSTSGKDEKDQIGEASSSGAPSLAGPQRRKRYSVMPNLAKPRAVPALTRSSPRTPRSPGKASSETLGPVSAPDSEAPGPSGQTDANVVPHGLRSPRRRRPSGGARQPRAQPGPRPPSPTSPDPTAPPPEERADQEAGPPQPAHADTTAPAVSSTPCTVSAPSTSQAEEAPPTTLPEKVLYTLPSREASEISERAQTLVSRSVKSGLSLAPGKSRLSRLLNDPTDLQRLAKARKLRELLRQEMNREKKTKKPSLRDYIVDPSKMTMRDLIYYLPESNPMTSFAEDKRREAEIVLPPSPSRDESPEGAQEAEEQPEPVSRREEEEEEDEENEGDEGEAGQDDQLMVPRVKVAEDGSLIIDEESLTVEVQRAKGPNLAEGRDPIFERGSTTTYSSFRKGWNTKPWSSQETDMFFLAINMVGTDFSMIGQLFPHRARTEIKNKFKREERENSWRIDKAFKERRKLDLEFFTKLLEKILAMREKKKSKSPAERKAMKKRTGKPKAKKAPKTLSDVEEEEEEEEEEDASMEGEKENEGVSNEEGTKKKRKRKDVESSPEKADGSKRAKGKQTSEQDEASVPGDTEAALPGDQSPVERSEETDEPAPAAKGPVIKPAQLSRGRAQRPIPTVGRRWGQRGPATCAKPREGALPAGEEEGTLEGTPDEQVDGDASPSKGQEKKQADDVTSSEGEDESSVAPAKRTRYGRLPKQTQHLNYPAKDSEAAPASNAAPGSASPAAPSSSKPQPPTRRAKLRPGPSLPQKKSPSAPKKPKLVTIWASQSESEGEELEAEEDVDLATVPEGDNQAPAFVPLGLRSPEPVTAEVEETMEELNISVNVPDVLGISHDALCLEASCQQAEGEQVAVPCEHQLDLLVDVIEFLSPEHMEVSQESYNEAARTLLTISSQALLSQDTQDYISEVIVEEANFTTEDAPSQCQQSEMTPEPTDQSQSSTAPPETSDPYTAASARAFEEPADSVPAQCSSEATPTEVAPSTNEQNVGDIGPPPQAESGSDSSEQTASQTKRSRFPKLRPKPNLARASRTAQPKPQSAGESSSQSPPVENTSTETTSSEPQPKPNLGRASRTALSKPQPVESTSTETTSSEPQPKPNLARASRTAQSKPPPVESTSTETTSSEPQPKPNLARASRTAQSKPPPVESTSTETTSSEPQPKPNLARASRTAQSKPPPVESTSTETTSSEPQPTEGTATLPEPQPTERTASPSEPQPIQRTDSTEHHGPPRSTQNTEEPSPESSGGTSTPTSIPASTPVPASEPPRSSETTTSQPVVTEASSITKACDPITPADSVPAHPTNERPITDATPTEVASTNQEKAGEVGPSTRAESGSDSSEQTASQTRKSRFPRLRPKPNLARASRTAQPKPQSAGESSSQSLPVESTSTCGSTSSEPQPKPNLALASRTAQSKPQPVEETWVSTTERIPAEDIATRSEPEPTEEMTSASLPEASPCTGTLPEPQRRENTQRSTPTMTSAPTPASTPDRHRSPQGGKVQVTRSPEEVERGRSDGKARRPPITAAGGSRSEPFDPDWASDVARGVRRARICKPNLGRGVRVARSQLAKSPSQRDPGPSTKTTTLGDLAAQILDDSNAPSRKPQRPLGGARTHPETTAQTQSETTSAADSSPPTACPAQTSVDANASQAASPPRVEESQPSTIITLDSEVMSVDQAPSDPEEPFFILSLTEIPLYPAGEETALDPQPLPDLQAPDPGRSQPHSGDMDVEEGVAGGDPGDMEADPRSVAGTARTSGDPVPGENQEQQDEAQTPRERSLESRRAAELQTRPTSQPSSAQPPSPGTATSGGKAAEEQGGGAVGPPDVPDITGEETEDGGSGAESQAVRGITPLTTNSPLSRPGRRPRGFLSFMADKGSLAATGPAKAASQKPQPKTSRRGRPRCAPVLTPTPETTRTPPEVEASESPDVSTSLTHPEPGVSEPCTSLSATAAEVVGSQQSEEEEPNNVSQLFFSDIFTEVEESGEVSSNVQSTPLLQHLGECQLPAGADKGSLAATGVAKAASQKPQPKTSRRGRPRCAPVLTSSTETTTTPPEVEASESPDVSTSRTHPEPGVSEPCTSLSATAAEVAGLQQSEEREPNNNRPGRRPRGFLSFMPDKGSLAATGVAKAASQKPQPKTSRRGRTQCAPVLPPSTETTTTPPEVEASESPDVSTSRTHPEPGVSEPCTSLSATAAEVVGSQQSEEEEPNNVSQLFFSDIFTEVEESGEVSINVQSTPLLQHLGECQLPAGADKGSLAATGVAKAASQKPQPKTSRRGRPRCAPVLTSSTETTTTPPEVEASESLDVSTSRTHPEPGVSKQTEPCTSLSATAAEVVGSQQSEEEEPNNVSQLFFSDIFTEVEESGEVSSNVQSTPLLQHLGECQLPAGADKGSLAATGPAKAASQKPQPKTSRRGRPRCAPVLTSSTETTTTPPEVEASESPDVSTSRTHPEPGVSEPCTSLSATAAEVAGSQQSEEREPNNNRPGRRPRGFLSFMADKGSLAATGPAKAASQKPQPKTSRRGRTLCAPVLTPTPETTRTPPEVEASESPDVSTSRTHPEPGVSEPCTSLSATAAEVVGSQQSEEEEPNNVSQFFFSDIFTEVEENEG